MSAPLRERTLRDSSIQGASRHSAGRRKRCKLWILVMGLTGAGKSTFISIITGNKHIRIGEPGEMDGVTEEVQDYVLLYPLGDVVYEVHLVDSPGFDDGNVADTEILSKIAQYINITYKLKNRLAGILYLHDMTKEKMGSVAKLNLRMLEQLIGIDKFSNCTIVTTKWGCSEYSRQVEREASLKSRKQYFGDMLDGPDKASIVRFEPSNAATALQIIQPFLRKDFVPHISEEMVEQQRCLGDTSAGKIVANNLEQLRQMQSSLEMVKIAQEVLKQKWDEQIFQEFKQKSKAMRRKHGMQKAGRWIMRTTIVGGAIVATVMTAGPGASAFALCPAYEKSVRTQRRSEAAARRRLEQEFRQQAALGSKLKNINSSWMWDKVNSLEELVSDRSSIASENFEGEKFAPVVTQGAVVGMAGGRMEDVVADMEAGGFTSDEDRSSIEERLELDMSKPRFLLSNKTL